MFMVGVDSAKFTIYGWLRLTAPGPGFSHFPVTREDDYFDGLTSEEVKTRMSRGFPVREWFKRPGARNEPLDCRVYAYAAMLSLGVNWNRLIAARLAEATKKQDQSENVETAPPIPSAPFVSPDRPARVRGGFVTTWR